MKKELVICIIVVILVIISNILTQNYTKESIAELNNNLINMKENIKSEERKELKENAKEAKQKWDDRQEILSCYIEHNELEKIETQLVLLSSNVEAELYKEAIPEIDKCIFILEHVSDKTALNIKNIF